MTQLACLVPVFLGQYSKDSRISMMTSSNGNIFRVPGHLCGEFIGHRWIHKGQWRGALVYSLICVQIKGWETIVRLVIWDAIAPIMTSFDLRRHFAHFEVIVMHCHRVSGRQWGIMACMMCTYSRSTTKPHSTVSTSPFCDDVILSTETQSELLTDTGNCKSVPNFGLASQTNTHAEFWCFLCC